ncbi:hypothetical protein BD410DRAFT_811517 [Rickenella mellea]|uniref:Uncharacterized protein n=1 Tax=Rickenella mellea TaxID=50990 RepID=A0A4Y7QL32_9AGAM|nr:hypothetical protein BD410DRAFT_811517 [Rickenella mellea]
MQRLDQPRFADLSFFTSAAATFKPRPYHAHSSHSVPHRKREQSPIPHNPNPAPPPDPTPDDPDATFIHPPFENFPNAHLHSDGLTYNVMAQNPEWFLDPGDFVYPLNPNPMAIPYPSTLEPPRGWCGSIKKKDVKEKGDGWPEGEEPRLRCTFCRRTYAGINAKSMWRRHVFEKHKIAMANRRDGPERGRGSRTANKENKQGASKDKTMYGHQNRNYSFGHQVEENDHENSFNHSSTKHSAGVPLAAKSRLRSLLPIGTPQSMSTSDSPRLSQDIFSPYEPELSYSGSNLDTSLSSPFSSPNRPSAALPPQLSPALNSVLLTKVVPSSPYDPTKTPAFKHTAQHLPSEQPWRFPSPSHPLHSSPDELCLGVAVGGITGEGLHSAYIPVLSSPASALKSVRTPLVLPSSPFTPARSSPLKRKFTAGKVLGFDIRRTMSESDMDLTLRGVPKPEPRLLFYSGPLPVPVSDRVDFKLDLSTSSAESECEGSSASEEVTLPSEAEDPFGVWFNLDGSVTMPADSPDSEIPPTTYPDSPVLRTVELPLTSRNPTPMGNIKECRWDPQPSGLGLGILMSSTSDEDDDILGELLYPSATDAELEEMARDLEEVEGELEYPPSSQEELEGPSDSPTDDEDFDTHTLRFVTQPPLKRRRTIDVVS